MTENLPIRKAALPSLLLDSERFEMAQRAGKLMSISALFPRHLTEGGREVAMANAVLVMNIADRMREDPLAVAQNIYFVHGRPGWNASYCISRANQSGVFKSTIRWKVECLGEPLKPAPDIELENLRVTAHATLHDGEKVEATVTMKTAMLEGWTRRSPKAPNTPSKYETMGELMLRYRAATLLIRLNCPEVMLGYQTREEIEDVVVAESMRDVTPPGDAEPAPAAQGGAEAAETPPEPPTDRKAAQERYRREQAANAAKGKGAAAGRNKAKAGAEIEDAETIEEEGSGDAAAEAARGAEPAGDAEAGTDASAFDPDSLPDHLGSVYRRLLVDLEESGDTGEIEGVLAMFAEQVEEIRAVSEAAGDALDEAETAARERVSSS